MSEEIHVAPPRSMPAELREALERSARGAQEKPALPVEFEHAEGDVVIRRLTEAEVKSPEVQARIVSWGERRVGRQRTVGNDASDGEPFEILVPIKMLANDWPETVVIKVSRQQEYSARVDYVTDGVARSLRPANEYADLARLTRPTKVWLRAHGAEPAEAEKTIRLA